MEVQMIRTISKEEGKSPASFKEFSTNSSNNSPNKSNTLPHQKKVSPIKLDNKGTVRRTFDEQIFSILLQKH